MTSDRQNRGCEWLTKICIVLRPLKLSTARPLTFFILPIQTLANRLGHSLEKPLSQSQYLNFTKGMKKKAAAKFCEALFTSALLMCAASAQLRT